MPKDSIRCHRGTFITSQNTLRHRQSSKRRRRSINLHKNSKKLQKKCYRSFSFNISLIQHTNQDPLWPLTLITCYYKGLIPWFGDLEVFGLIWLLNRGRTLWIQDFPSYLGFLFSLGQRLGALELAGCLALHLESSIYRRLHWFCSTDAQSCSLRHSSEIGTFWLVPTSTHHSEIAM